MGELEDVLAVIGAAGVDRAHVVGHDWGAGVAWATALMAAERVLTLPSDNGTWSVTTYISSGDQPLKRMRDPDAWSAVVKACPLHAHWLDDPLEFAQAWDAITEAKLTPWYRETVARAKARLSTV